MVLNATFNNYNYILAVRFIGEEIGVPGENQQPVASHLQTLSHNVA